MKRNKERRNTAKRAQRGTGRKVAAKRARRPGPILEESALARATAKAAASIKTSLREEPAFLAEEALKEAEQIGMLLADQDDEEDPETHEDEEEGESFQIGRASCRERV